MLIFINANGEVVGTTPLGITQGSSKANTLQLVCPFPTALVSLSFQLPNGIILGPYLEGTVEIANEYVMQQAFTIPGYGVEGSELAVYTYTCNKEISALSGKLGVQFFIHVGEIVAGEGADEYGGYTLAVPMIQIPIYNGTKFIPAPEIPEVNTWNGILELLSILRTNIEQTAYDLLTLEGNAVLKNPGVANQTIDSDVTLSAGKTLRADKVAATNVSMDKAEIGGKLIFSFRDTEFEVYPILDNGVIVLRMPGKVEAEHISSRRGDIGTIYTEYGISIDPYYGDIRFEGDGGAYRIRANWAHDDSLDQDYLVGITLIGDENSIEGNLTIEGDAKVRGTIHGQRANFTNANIAGDLNVSGNTRGDVAYFNELDVDHILNVYGGLNVNGPITSVSQEKLIVKDNIIVTNSDGLSFSSSGIVINKGNGKAYGILYQPAGDLVYIGEGTYSLDNEGNPNFSFDAGEALPLAARSDNFRTDNEIPVFDTHSKSLVPSGKTPSNFVPKSTSTVYREAYVNNYGENGTMRIVQDVGENNDLRVYTIACRNPNGGMTVADPINDLDAVNKRYLDNLIMGIEQTLSEINDGGIV